MSDSFIGSFRTLAALAIVAALHGGAAQAAPHVILIMADDMD